MKNKEKKGFLSSVKNFAKNNKVLTVVGGSALLCNSAFAGVTYDLATNEFKGDIVLTPFYTAAGLVVTVLGAIYAVKAGIRMLKS